MYLNRKHLTLLGKGDRGYEQIEVNKNLLTSVQEYSQGNFPKQMKHRQGLPTVSNFGQESEISPSITEPLQKQPNLINGKDITFFLSIPILFLIVGFIVRISCQKLGVIYSITAIPSLLGLSKNKLQPVEQTPKITCYQCHFFNNNHYLKCAVHPDKVLKKEAQDCVDYQEKSQVTNQS